jgi:hypothetical protein
VPSSAFKLSLNGPTNALLPFFLFLPLFFFFLSPILFSTLWNGKSGPACMIVACSESLFRPCCLCLPDRDRLLRTMVIMLGFKVQPYLTQTFCQAGRSCQADQIIITHPGPAALDTWLQADSISARLQTQIHRRVTITVIVIYHRLRVICHNTTQLYQNLSAPR